MPPSPCLTTPPCPGPGPAVNYSKRHVVEFYTRLGAALPEIVHHNKSVACELRCPEVQYKSLHVPALTFHGEGMFMKVGLQQQRNMWCSGGL